MTFRVSLLIDADGKAAVVGIKRVGDAMRQTTAETRKLGDTSQVAEASARGLSNAQRVGAQTADALSRSHRVAAGSVGNLTAQFNDIGVMLAAGQNPLTLALQQGTQISQVLGPMGAGGAVTALGSALRGMLNPVSLITIGSIAAGAAMVQWLTGAAEDALTVEDALAETAETLDALDAASKRASLSTAEMMDEFGSASPILRAVLADMAGLAKLDAYKSIDQTADAVRNLVLDLGLFDERSSQSAAQDFLGLDSLRSSSREAGALFARNLELLSDSEVPAQKLAAAMNLRDQLLANSGGIDTMTASQKEFYDGLLATIRDLDLLGVKLASFGTATADLRAQVQLQQELTQATVDQRVEAARSRAQDEKAAASMLAATAERSNLQALIAQYGAESAQVAEAQAAAARAVYEAEVNALDVTAARKNELMVSYDVERLMASLNIAGPLGAGADQAGRMAGNLSAALSFAQQIAMVQAATPAAPPALGFGLGAAPNGGTGTTLGFGNNRGSNFNAPPTNFGDGGGAGGGGGGGAAREERDAVAELIARLQEEAEIRAELDPVQQEMIRYREELSGATADQRAEVEALIEAEQREAEAAEATQERWGYLRDTAYDALLTMAKGGDDASDALRNLGASLAEAAFQAAIMGEGPLGSLFGGTSIFSLIGGALGIGGGGIPGKAKGGMITGPGDGTSDSILMYGSSGEMMMNARAVRKNRHLLEAMNANAPIRGYARGGMIGGGAISRDTSAGSSGPVQISIDVTGARGNTEIMSMVRAGVEQGMAHYDRMILPTSLKRVSADSRRIG